MRTSRGEQNL
ncbi:unnamed protein product, partial [Allacma fusca]